MGQENETRSPQSYPLLARDDAVPQQQVNGTIGQLLWLGDEPLKHAKANTDPLSKPGGITSKILKEKTNQQ